MDFIDQLTSILKDHDDVLKLHSLHLDRLAESINKMEKIFIAHANSINILEKEIYSIGQRICELEEDFRKRTSREPTMD